MNHDMHHGNHSAGHADHEHVVEIEDTRDTHGMLVVGAETVYLSHLPMFGHPHHDIQAILEATFTNEGGAPQSVYANDRERTGTKIYTLVPKPFILSELVSIDSHRLPRRSFEGEIFRGHFERPGREKVADAVITVTNIVQFRQFDPAHEELSRLEYLLFGKGHELFMAHRITTPPDFDQILSVGVVGHEFTDEELRHGVPVVVPGRANSMVERIKEGQQVAAEAQLAGEDTPRTVEIQIQAGIEFYFEEGELRFPMVMDPTEEEIAAGFG
jgi:hypothetical protein